MPTVYANGDVNIQLTWMAEIAVGGDCVWEVAFEKHEPGVDDLDANSFATGIIFVATADVTPGVPTETIIPVTSGQMDGVVQGDQFRLAVRRLGDDSSQSMSGNAQLMTVVVEQDADPAGGGGGGFWTDGAGTRAGIGQGSPAPLADGEESLAHGTNATAPGANSLALMRGAIGGVTGGVANACIALGRGAEALAPYGVAIGRNAQVRLAAQTRSVAIGYAAEIDQDTGGDGIAIGSYAQARGTGHSIAIGTNAFGGDNAPANGFCIGIGYHAYAGRDGAIAIGKNVAAYKDESIAIGQDIYIYSNYRIIGIGHDINVGTVFDASDTIAIGGNITAPGGTKNILIGTNLGAGSQEVIIGHNNQGDRTNASNNIIISTDDNNYHGSTDPRGQYTGGNLVLVSGGNSGGLRPWFENAQFRNICITTGQGYIYGYSHDNNVLGAYIDMGDYNNQLTETRLNTHIGIQGRTSWYNNAGGDNVTEENTVIGYNCQIGTGAKQNFAGGHNCSVFAGFGLANYAFTKYNTAFGAQCEITGGYGNVLFGYDNEMDHATYTGSNWHLGNAAIGVHCKIVKTGTGGFRSTLAQGVGVNIAVSAQRAFGADANVSFVANANQGSFVIPKIETTDATQTTILTFPTTADKAYGLWGWLIARRTDADGFNATFSLSNTLVYRNAAGAPVLVGDPKAWVMDSNQGAPGWTIDISINVNDIVVRVTGTAAQTIEWLGWIQVIEVRG
jgi:hypothetical protein